MAGWLSTLNRLQPVCRTHHFLPSSGRNQCWYSLHLPTEGWPGWVVWKILGTKF